MVINENFVIWTFAILIVLGIPFAIWFTVKDLPSVKQARRNYINGPLMLESEIDSQKESILNRILQSFAVVCSLSGILNNFPILYAVGLIGWLPVLLFSPHLRSIIDVVTYIILHALAVALVLGIAAWLAEAPTEMMASSYVFVGLGIVITAALGIKLALGHFQTKASEQP